MSECEQELQHLEPDYSSRRQALEVLKEQIARMEGRVETLYGKQGRGRQFASKQERDTFLEGQIVTLKEHLAGKEALLNRMRIEGEAEEARLSEEKRVIVASEEENRGSVGSSEELSKGIQVRIITEIPIVEFLMLLYYRVVHICIYHFIELFSINIYIYIHVFYHQELTLRRNQLQEQRKTCWRELELFGEQMQEAKQDLVKGKQQLSSSLPRMISQGLLTVERIVEERGITGYYGPLIDNFTVKTEAFRTAVEVAGGNSLFHVIVDSDTTAAFFMTELEKRKAGRLTFLPLNRLRNPDVVYPDSADVRSLMEVALEFDPSMEQAMKQVFSKKLLARDLDSAAHYSKEYQLDAITKEGDQVNRKGGFEGGYHDERTSRIAASEKIRMATARLSALAQQEVVLKKKSEDADAAVNEVC